MLDPARPIKDLLRDPVDPARTQVVWQRLRERRPSRAVPGFALVLAGSVAALGLWALSRDRPDAPSATASTRPAASVALSSSDGGPIPAVMLATDAPRVLALSDASTIALDPGSELRTLFSTPTAFASELLRGAATFEVTPGGPRVWTVRAGSVEVTVLGTRFRVERGEHEVSVSVERGVVRVAGANVPGGAKELRAGQSVRVEDPKDPTVAATPGASEATAAGEAAPALPSRPSAGKPAHPSEASRVAPASPVPGVDELLASADRARAAGEPAQAALSLRQVVELHPGDPRAPLAALTLGRLYVKLGRPAEAVTALERATALGLPAALGEEAAAFLVLAHTRAGQPEDARVAALRYQAAFPNGRWTASIRQWLGSR